MFNGTAANSLALASLCQSYNSILCHELAHVENRRVRRAGIFSNGTKVLTMPGEDGKCSESITRMVKAKYPIFITLPRVVKATH